MIGDDIVITIVRIGAYVVRVGIDAPANIDIHREEIWESIQAEKNCMDCDCREEAGSDGHDANATDGI